ncbi:3-hydroxyacylnad binding [Diaporthe amygdali]|uniref:3-hydroxyacyl-CoA dehydrogenase family protein n=1 Tax=Phomopsis amygdali TaxID=1214568 RepID=UPI0022FDEA1F|nr:3-hydroxyacyl-CoA dehydrogenase family protein [Diaporthe amygdali]KAJ0118367.1 3-hydroxyacylnad binding [Diaporthe amygdali]
MSSSWHVPEDYHSRPIAILGGGVLGRRIATSWVAAGYDVCVRDPDASQRKACEEYVKANARDYPAAKANLNGFGEISTQAELPDAVRGAWLVIEAVPEKLQIKIDTFADLEAHAPKDAILASNSSSYKSSEMLDKIKDEATKARILNTHYYMPPVNNVVELMTCGFTEPVIIEFLFERQKEAGTTPYVARKESTGLIFNRLWAAVKREVLTILAEEVSTPQEIDEMFTTMFKTSMGPCKMMDDVGLDTVAFIESHYVAERGLPSEKTVDFVQKKYIDKGRLGAKSQKGGLYPRVPRLLVLDLGLAATKISPAPGFVLEMSGDGKNEKALVKSQALPDGIDVDKSSGRMFWTCMGLPGQPNGEVFSANFEDGSDVKCIVPKGVANTPKQLVVEPTSKKLYFCDREGMRVFRCNYDGSELETIIKTGDWEADGFEDQTKWCVGITVSPKHGKFYWTQKAASKSGKGRIFCANIDMPAGKTAETRPDIELLLDNLPEPIDLEIDDSTDLLYWTDRGELPLGNSVNRATLDPTSGLVAKADSKKPYEVLVRHLNEAIGLKLDLEAGHIYLTDLGGSLYKCNLDGSGKQRIYNSDERALAGITIV